MKPRNSAITVMLALSLGAFAACVEDDDAESPGGEAELSLNLQATSLRANPDGQIRAVLVGMDGISAHNRVEGWTDLYATGIYDLMRPESVPWMLGTANLPQGMYDEIRIKVAFAAVLTADGWYPLEIPSGEQSGIKIHTNFCLVGGDVVNLNLDWNVDDAVHYQTHRGYWMTPSIQVMSPPSCTDDLRTP